MKATIVFFPNERKKNSKSGRIPIYMRICFRRKKVENRLNVEIDETELSIWDPFNMRLQKKNTPEKHYLNRIQQKFDEFVIMESTNLSQHTAFTIRDYVLGLSDKRKINLMEWVDKYFEEAVLNNVNKTISTIKNYRRAINHLVAFVSFSKKQQITVDEVNFDFAASFKNFLVSSNTSIGRVGMCEVSAATVIKKFRTIFSHAVDQEIISKNPFKQVKIKTKSSRKERLTIDQIKVIRNLNLDRWRHLYIYRDIFLFSVYTGLAYHDAMDLNWSNLEKKSDGNIKLSINRIKTSVITECFLTKPAIEIVENYLNNNELQSSNKILPYKSNQKLNHQLKLLAQIAGISIKLTSHTARHTFRQLLSEAEIEDYGVIKRLMGHGHRGDVDEIYYQVTEKRLLIAKEKLNKYLIDFL